MIGLKSKKRMYITVLYPSIPLSDSDIYVITTRGDRYDLLSLRFYSTSEYWWIISSANESLQQNSLLITPGTQIRIPINIQSILESYNTLNSL